MEEISTSTLQLQIFQHPDVINIIAKTIFGDNGPILVHDVTNIRSDSCDIVYLPRHEHGGELRTIILSIQKKTSASSMKHSLKLCLQVSKQYNIQPFFIVLCIGAVAPSLKEFLSPVPLKPHWSELKDTLWAEKCLIILKECERGDTVLQHEHDPLIALVWYLSMNKKEKEKLRTIDNATIQLLLQVESLFN